MPDAVGLGNVALPARANGQSWTAVAAKHHDDAVGIDRRGVRQLAGAGARPQFLAGVRIEAFQLIRDGKDQLVVIVHTNDNGSAPGAQPVAGLVAVGAARLVVFPDLGAGLFVEGSKELAFAGAAPED